MKTANVFFINEITGSREELEIPVEITAKELIIALDTSYCLGIDTDDMTDCYLVSENPIALLHGDRLLTEFGIHNGTDIIFVRGKNG